MAYSLSMKRRAGAQAFIRDHGGGVCGRLASAIRT